MRDRKVRMRKMPPKDESHPHDLETDIGPILGELASS